MLSWFEFLLRHCVRPYQFPAFPVNYLRSIDFDSQVPKIMARSNIRAYFCRARNVYGDRVSDLACELNARSGGAVIRRLERIYAAILIDEFQDLAGYDLDFVELLFQSNIATIVVGDPRQQTFETTRSSKNKQFQGAGLHKWFAKIRKKVEIEVEELTTSYRCRQEICDFGDRLFPNYSPTRSANNASTEHDGIFWLQLQDVPRYLDEFHPKPLRWSETSKDAPASSENFGAVKGATFDRVLIFPTALMLDYLGTSDHSKLKPGTLSKLYVAATRARQSVAFAVAKKNFRTALARRWPSME